MSIGNTYLSIHVVESSWKDSHQMWELSILKFFAGTSSFLLWQNVTILRYCTDAAASGGAKAIAIDSETYKSLSGTSTLRWIVYWKILAAWIIKINKFRENVVFLLFKSWHLLGPLAWNSCNWATLPRFSRWSSFSFDANGHPFSFSCSLLSSSSYMKSCLHLGGVYMMGRQKQL